MEYFTSSMLAPGEAVKCHCRYVVGLMPVMSFVPRSTAARNRSTAVVVVRSGSDAAVMLELPISIKLMSRQFGPGTIWALIKAIRMTTRGRRHLILKVAEAEECIGM